MASVPHIVAPQRMTIPLAKSGAGPNLTPARGSELEVLTPVPPNTVVVTKVRMAEQRRTASQTRESGATEGSARSLGGPDSSRVVTVHVHQLVQAFAVGILEADPWHAGYTIAPKLDAVVNHVSRCVQVRFPGEDVLSLPLGVIERLYRAWTEQHPVMRGWNRLGNPPPTEYLPLHSSTPRARQFIDLDAVYRNAIAYLARTRDADAPAQARSAASESVFMRVRANQPRSQTRYGETARREPPGRSPDSRAPILTR
jgi:hypothetical protein